jgi:hypothetical protein
VSRRCVPEGVTEAEVVAAIEEVSRRLAKQYAFGPYAQDDIKGFVALYSCEALAAGRYDRNRPLANFLYTNARNRLLNLKRDSSHRADTPCKACHAGTPCQPEGQCEAYRRWWARNSAKASIFFPNSANSAAEIAEENELRPQPSVVGQVEVKELRELIDERLPVELRADYLRMLSGEPVETSVRKRVRAAVLEIMEEAGVGQDITLP